MNNRHIAIHNYNQFDEVKSTSLSTIVIDKQCPVFRYINSLNSDSSKLTAQRVVHAIANHIGAKSYHDLQWQRFDDQTTNDLISVLKQKDLAPATISLYVSVLKGVIEQAYFLEQTTRLKLDAVKKINGTTGYRKKRHKVIDRNDFEKLVERIAEVNTGKPVSAARDIAIFHLLVGTGLRRNELVNLQLDAIEEKVISIIGKGNKERHVALHPITKKALDVWIEHRGKQAGPLFYRVSKADRILFVVNGKKQNGLSGSAIYDMCKKYSTVAPHSLRRSYATWLYGSGMRMDRISKQLGHSNLATTEVYLVDDEQEIYEDVIDKLF